jgi:hypothetical protein
MVEGAGRIAAAPRLDIGQGEFGRRGGEPRAGAILLRGWFMRGR